MSNIAKEILRDSIKEQNFAREVGFIQRQEKIQKALKPYCFVRF
ncbi:hypothetical protein [Marinisporobacter balticus]|uniref:Uncharacterized protein n=1 Tax=Marinisporobacter balticus TaxID=2018667 RepID=A0A4R2KEL5_9FIRM|nr:hypothetical protein [Marinisporobacter balticus]TCO70647.1 hypothetical protein EV214_12517 [Marinisporobacter balticus]